VTLRVTEVFFSIQGEGTRAGLPCVFVRLTGCPLRCTWCDTAYAFTGGETRKEDDLLAEIESHPTDLVELTGGEPLSQPAAFPFITRLLDARFQVMVETSGHVSLQKLDPRAIAIMDVKAPASGETHRMDWDNIARLKPSDEAKFVLADRADYEWARGVIVEHRLPERCAVLVSPVHGVLDPGTLARWVLDDGLSVRLQVQLHKYLWPGVERGV
jgi:7-carboxy-7-deazaguanine synthase